VQKKKTLLSEEKSRKKLPFLPTLPRFRKKKTEILTFYTSLETGRPLPSAPAEDRAYFTEGTSKDRTGLEAAILPEQVEKFFLSIKEQQPFIADHFSRLINSAGGRTSSRRKT
jgi:hypothetical protein